MPEVTNKEMPASNTVACPGFVVLCSLAMKCFILVHIVLEYNYCWQLFKLPIHVVTILILKRLKSRFN